MLVPGFVWRRKALGALVVLAIVGASGCAAGVGAEEEDAVTSTTDALMRGGGHVGAGYSCSGGTCTCDKSIENDCEDMSGACTDATVDALINCINGWLTTHCTCTQGLVAPNPKSPYAAPTGGVYTQQLSAPTTVIPVAPISVAPTKVLSVAR
jgi:hypothetical protein